MIGIMRKPTPVGADPATEAAYDALRFEAARACAPYMHPRLSNRDRTVAIGPVTGTVVERANSVLEALANAEITPSEAATVMQTLAAQARILEIYELERRVQTLEGMQHGKPQS